MTLEEETRNCDKKVDTNGSSERRKNRAKKKREVRTAWNGRLAKGATIARLRSRSGRTSKVKVQRGQVPREKKKIIEVENFVWPQHRFHGCRPRGGLDRELIIRDASRPIGSKNKRSLLARYVRIIGGAAVPTRAVFQ